MAEAAGGTTVQDPASAAIDSARAEFAQKFNAPESTAPTKVEPPTPAPSSSPAPPPAAAPEAAAPKAPESTAPGASNVATPEAAAAAPTTQQTGSTLTVDPNSLPEDFRQVLEAQGGDIAKALAAYKQPTTTAPAAEPEPEPEPVQIDTNQVKATVEQALGRDQDIAQWRQQYTALDARLTEIGKPLQQGGQGELAQTQNELGYLTRRLKDADVQADTFAQDQIRTQITQLETRRDRLEGEYDRLEQRAGKIRNEYNARAKHYEDAVTNHLTQQAQTALREKAFNERVEQHRESMAKAWPETFKRICTEQQVPQEEQADFELDLKDAALARVNAGLDVGTLHAFMTERAKKLVQRIDRIHRAKSKEYALQATQRADQPGPTPTPAPAPAPAATKASPDDLEAVMDTARSEAQQAWKRVGLRRVS